MDFVFQFSYLMMFLFTSVACFVVFVYFSCLFCFGDNSFALDSWFVTVHVNCKHFVIYIMSKRCNNATACRMFWDRSD